MVKLESFPVKNMRKIILSEILNSFSSRFASFITLVKGKRFINLFFFKFLDSPDRSIKVF